MEELPLFSSISAVGGTGTYTGTGTFSVGAGTYTYPVSDANGCTPQPQSQW
ncbi:MAG: hypothetical protein IPH88_05875 [Bacteroidales bacterium]|nr:hypothetical protein [Bacteroidales bacterium]